MHTIDLLILLALAGGLAVGFKTGLIKQVVSFVGLIVSFLLALNLMHGIGGMAADSLGISEDIAPLVGFALVFLAVQVLVFALIRLGEAVIGALRLTTVNRLLGGAVGAFKAAVVLSVAFLVLGFLDVPSEETQQASAFYEPVATVLPATWDYATAAFPQIEQLSEQFSQRLEERLPTETPEGEE